MKFHLKIWRQSSKNKKGFFEEHTVENISPDMSFLEMLDFLNEKLISQGKTPIEFDHDCREGICGSCSLSINSDPHGHEKNITACQLHMRSFKEGEKIKIEPFKVKAFPVLKDLIVDRSSFDRIIEKGGFVSVKTGSASEANTTKIPKKQAEEAFLSAACIGCGACVAACKNASASLFVAAKIKHLNLLPQGEPEKKKRVLDMVAQMDKEQFGSCSNTKACSAACPKGISTENIAFMNKEFIKASFSDS